MAKKTQAAAKAAAGSVVDKKKVGACQCGGPIYNMLVAPQRGHSRMAKACGKCGAEAPKEA